MAQLLKGRRLAKRRRKQMAERVAELKHRGIEPCLCPVLVGHDPASEIYVRNKVKACGRIGMESRVVRLPEEVSERDVLGTVDELSRDESVHGIIVQLPLPKHIDVLRVQLAIHPDKDVDGLHPHNLGLLLAGKPGFVPCTPLGVLALLDSAEIELQGKHGVVIGRSVLVGKPVAQLLVQRHVTVTTCHTRTPDLAREARRADVLIVAAGVPRLVTGDWVKPGAAVVDVGINRLDSGDLVGDVDFDSVNEVAGYLTPVPGGVGPMTISMLLENTLRAAEA